jgi:hypothetical protein
MSSLAETRTSTESVIIAIRTGAAGEPFGNLIGAAW